MSKPMGFTRCSVQPVLAHSRMMLPVLGGISGLDEHDVEHVAIL